MDLAIDRGTTPPTHDTTWNSGYEVKAKVDRNARVWYGAMRIPLESLGIRAPKNGAEARLNLYRCQGPTARSQVHQLAAGEQRVVPHAGGLRPPAPGQLTRESVCRPARQEGP